MEMESRDQTGAVRPEGTAAGATGREADRESPRPRGDPPRGAVAAGREVASGVSTGSGPAPGGRAVVLFDGRCRLCESLVRFLLRHDRRRHLLFAPFESRAGRELLESTGLGGGSPESLVLVEGEHAYRESTAALRVLRGLGGPWRLLQAFVAVPRPVRDAAYRLIARHRYRWFAGRRACVPLAPGEKERFLE